MNKGLGEPELARFAARVSTIAIELNRSGIDAAPACGSARAAPDLEAVAQALLAQRHTRRHFLPASLFHEPAWEILLSLYATRSAVGSVSVKHLVTLVDGPVTTSQRWIDQLVHMKLLQRVVDPLDRRRLEISLSQQGESAVENYLVALVDKSERKVLGAPQQN